MIFSLFCLSCPPPSLRMVPAMASLRRQSPPAAYQKFIRNVTHLYQNAREAVSRFYWETGRGIVEVQQDGQVRARYGARLLQNISRDLSHSLGSGFSVPNLKRMRSVYLRGEKGSTSSLLTWSQRVELLPVKDKKLRSRLEQRAVHEGLSAREIRNLVRAVRKQRNVKAVIPAEAGIQTRLLEPIKGTIGIYRIIKAHDKLQWDRGFEAYRELTPEEAGTLKDGDFVKSKRSKGGSWTLSPVPATPKDLYTYEAELIRVIDADTFWMRIWYDRPEWRKEKLRLRGIDAPELSTSEGQEAKEFVEELFKKAKAITVTTTKPDKYHRYLSDVYIEVADSGQPSANSKSKIAKTSNSKLKTVNSLLFLNNHLLETGRAVRMGKIPAGEWDKE